MGFDDLIPQKTIFLPISLILFFLFGPQVKMSRISSRKTVSPARVNPLIGILFYNYIIIT